MLTSRNDPPPPFRAGIRPQRILVTGAAGFIGSHLTERLLSAGHEVVGLDNFNDFYDPAIKEENLRVARGDGRFTEVRGDIRDPEIYAALPDDIDTVVHLAAMAGVRPSIEDPLHYQDVNLRGTTLLLEFMRSRGVPRLLFGSSSSVYGDAAPVPFSESDAADLPISPYAATKRAGELLVHTGRHLWGIDAVCLRFFTVYGPRQRPDLAIHKFARLLSEAREIPMYGDGTSERDYTFIDDILDGVEGALRYVTDHPGTYEVVNLGGARTVKLATMIDLLASSMGVRARIARVDDQPGDVRQTFADVSKAERLLGYRPHVSFEEGLRHFVAWFDAEHTASRPVAQRR